MLLSLLLSIIGCAPKEEVSIETLSNTLECEIYSLDDVNFDNPSYPMLSTGTHSDNRISLQYIAPTSQDIESDFVPESVEIKVYDKYGKEIKIKETETLYPADGLTTFVLHVKSVPKYVLAVSSNSSYLLEVE